jgi:uncharacterized membrane protein
MALGMTMDKRINAPVDRVFDVFTDLRSAPQRVRGIKALEVLTEGPVGKGTRFRETRVMWGKEATETMEFTEFRPNSMYAVEANSCGCHYRSEFHFRPDGGATDVRMTFGGTPLTTGAKIMSALMGWMVKGACRKAMDQDLEDLKAAAEQRA